MQVRSGARSAVLIAGEAGIGKTRLVSELAHAVHGEGTFVLYGRCDEGLAVPYQPFVEALRPCAYAVGKDRLGAELGDLALQLGRLLPELRRFTEPSHSDPESERFALFEAVATLFEVMTREQRGLLIVDDLHWATRPTLLLLRHLIRCERPLSLLIVAAYRETDIDPSHPLHQMLGDLHRDVSTRRLNLTGLATPEITALLQASLGQLSEDGRVELVQMLTDRTAGNPFFIRELLAHMTESGAISTADQRLSSGQPATQLDVPEGLRHVIGQRVARLAGPTQRMLQAAAVAGPTFSFMLLERVLEERSDVLDVLDEAVGAGLLTECGQDHYGFAHALVRETIYERLGAARRMRLHRQLGEALEAFGETDANIEALAHHFAQAAADGQADKAADYALAAGASATARFGFEEAAAHYERGLQALALSTPPSKQRGGRLLAAHEWRRCELLLGLGAAYWGAGELDKARHAFKRAASRATPVQAAIRARRRMLTPGAPETTKRADSGAAGHGDAATLARAALGYCGPHRFEVARAVTRAAAELLEQALAALGEEDGALRARVMGRLATALGHADEKRAWALAREALAMARRVADKATLADVLASAHWSLHHDTVPQSLERAVELGRLADELGDLRLRALAHMWRVDLLLTLADIEAVEHELDALQLLARTQPDRYLDWLTRVLQASHAILQGRLEDGEMLARDALERRFEGHDETATRAYMTQLLFMRIGQGRFEEAIDIVAACVEQYPEVVTWHYLRAFIHAYVGRTQEARRELDVLAHANFTDLPRDEAWLTNLFMIAGTVSIIGDVPRAEIVYERLLPYADHCIVSGALLSQGSASLPLGTLATTLARFEDAQRHFERALTINTQTRSPIWIARTQHSYAGMLLLRNHAGDRDHALHLLAEAIATAERLGLKSIADRTRSLKLAAETVEPSLALPRPA